MIALLLPRKTWYIVATNQATDHYEMMTRHQLEMMQKNNMLKLNNQSHTLKQALKKVDNGNQILAQHPEYSLNYKIMNYLDWLLKPAEWFEITVESSSNRKQLSKENHLEWLLENGHIKPLDETLTIKEACRRMRLGHEIKIKYGRSPLNATMKLHIPKK